MPVRLQNDLGDCLAAARVGDAKVLVGAHDCPGRLLTLSPQTDCQSGTPSAPAILRSVPTDGDFWARSI